MEIPEIPLEPTEEQKELKDFLEAVYGHCQTMIDDYKETILRIESTVYSEPTWEELYDQKTLHTFQREIVSYLDSISNLNTRLNYLRGEYKRSKIEYSTIIYPHKYTHQGKIEDYIDALKDYEKSLKSLEIMWDRRYQRIKTVSFLQNSERYKNLGT